MKINSIRCCGCETPLGVDRDPVITWLLEGAKQTAWRVQFAKGGHPVLDTGWQSGSDTFAHLPFPLEGCTRYEVTVCCRSDKGQTARATSYFETGLFPEQRKAGFVTTPGYEAPLFRKTFTANSAAGGRAYFCGLGYGVLFLNGRPVSDD